jgi:hypothetical protein
MKNNLNCIAIICLFICFSDCWIAKAQNLTLSIELDKKELIEGEPVYLLVTLKNPTFQTKKYNMLSFGSGLFHLSVIDERGNTLRYYGLILHASEPTYSLAPSESVQYLCDISHYYSNVFEKFEKGVNFPSPIVARMLSGSYKVKAHFRNGDVTLHSNELLFTVIAPVGDNAKLLEILKIKFRREFLEGKDNEIKISTFQELSKSYAHSIYFPLIQEQLASFYFSKGDANESKKILKNIIKTNPNSGYAMDAFRSPRLSVGEKEKLLEEIKLKSPQSRVVRFGENILKSTSK